MADTVAPWWRGLTCDHIYERCPGRLRGLPELVMADWDGPGMGALDPDGGDVCGLCLHWWRARNRASGAVPGGDG